MFRRKTSLYVSSARALDVRMARDRRANQGISPGYNIANSALTTDWLLSYLVQTSQRVIIQTYPDIKNIMSRHNVCLLRDNTLIVLLIFSSFKETLLTIAFWREASWKLFDDGSSGLKISDATEVWILRNDFPCIMSIAPSTDIASLRSGYFCFVAQLVLYLPHVKQLLIQPTN